MINPHPVFHIMLTDWEDAKNMFDLSESTLSDKVLFFPGGISSVNAELSEKGKSVTTVDSAYTQDTFDMEKLQAEILQSYSLDWEREHKTREVGQQPLNEKIISKWQKISDAFLKDYQKGRQEGRYVSLQDSLKLPFDDNAFSLACCPGVLIEDQTAILNLINELLRVADEVRIFPYLLKGEDAQKTLASVMLVLQQQGYGVELRNVEYQSPFSSNVMLRIWSKTCMVV